MQVVSGGRLPDLDDKHCLPFIMATLHEVLRRFTVCKCSPKRAQLITAWKLHCCMLMRTLQWLAQSWMVYVSYVVQLTFCNNVNTEDFSQRCQLRQYTTLTQR